MAAGKRTSGHRIAGLWDLRYENMGFLMRGWTFALLILDRFISKNIFRIIRKIKVIRHFYRFLKKRADYRETYVRINGINTVERNEDGITWSRVIKDEANKHPKLLYRLPRLPTIESRAILFFARLAKRLFVDGKSNGLVLVKAFPSAWWQVLILRMMGIKVLQIYLDVSPGQQEIRVGKKQDYFQGIDKLSRNNRKPPKLWRGVKVISTNYREPLEVLIDVEQYVAEKLEDQIVSSAISRSLRSSKRDIDYLSVAGRGQESAAAAVINRTVSGPNPRLPPPAGEAGARQGGPFLDSFGELSPYGETSASPLELFKEAIWGSMLRRLRSPPQGKIISLLRHPSISSSPKSLHSSSDLIEKIGLPQVEFIRDYLSVAGRGLFLGQPNNKNSGSYAESSSALEENEFFRLLERSQENSIAIYPVGSFGVYFPGLLKGIKFNNIILMPSSEAVTALTVEEIMGLLNGGINSRSFNPHTGYLVTTDHLKLHDLPKISGRTIRIEQIGMFPNSSNTEGYIKNEELAKPILVIVKRGEEIFAQRPSRVKIDNNFIDRYHDYYNRNNLVGIWFIGSNRLDRLTDQIHLPIINVLNYRDCNKVFLDYYFLSLKHESSGVDFSPSDRLMIDLEWQAAMANKQGRIFLLRLDLYGQGAQYRNQIMPLLADRGFAVKYLPREDKRDIDPNPNRKETPVIYAYSLGESKQEGGSSALSRKRDETRRSIGLRGVKKELPGGMKFARAEKLSLLIKVVSRFEAYGRDEVDRERQQRVYALLGLKGKKATPANVIRRLIGDEIYGKLKIDDAFFNDRNERERIMELRDFKQTKLRMEEVETRFHKRNRKKSPQVRLYTQGSKREIVSFFLTGEGYLGDELVYEINIERVSDREVAIRNIFILLSWYPGDSEELISLAGKVIDAMSTYLIIFILTADNKDYFWQKSKAEYFANEIWRIGENYLHKELTDVDKRKLFEAFRDTLAKLDVSKDRPMRPIPLAEVHEVWWDLEIRDVGGVEEVLSKIDMVFYAFIPVILSIAFRKKGNEPVRDAIIQAFPIEFSSMVKMRGEINFAGGGYWTSVLGDVFAELTREEMSTLLKKKWSEEFAALRDEADRWLQGLDRKRREGEQLTNWEAFNETHVRFAVNNVFPELIEEGKIGNVRHFRVLFRRYLNEYINKLPSFPGELIAFAEAFGNLGRVGVGTLAKLTAINLRGKEEDNRRPVLNVAVSQAVNSLVKYGCLNHREPWHEGLSLLFRDPELGPIAEKEFHSLWIEYGTEPTPQVSNIGPEEVKSLASFLQKRSRLKEMERVIVERLERLLRRGGSSSLGSGKTRDLPQGPDSNGSSAMNLSQNKEAKNLRLGYKCEAAHDAGISTSWIPTNLSGSIDSDSASRQSCIASLILLSNSGIVLACVWQPFIVGAVPTYILSWSFSIKTRNSFECFIFYLQEEDNIISVTCQESNDPRSHSPVQLGNSFPNNSETVSSAVEIDIPPEQKEWAEAIILLICTPPSVNRVTLDDLKRYFPEAVHLLIQRFYGLQEIEFFTSYYSQQREITEMMQAKEKEGHFSSVEQLKIWQFEHTFENRSILEDKRYLACKALPESIRILLSILSELAKEKDPQFSQIINDIIRIIPEDLEDMLDWKECLRWVDYYNRKGELNDYQASLMIYTIGPYHCFGFIRFFSKQYRLFETGSKFVDAIREVTGIDITSAASALLGQQYRERERWRLKGVIEREKYLIRSPDDPNGLTPRYNSREEIFDLLDGSDYSEEDRWRLTRELAGKVDRLTEMLSPQEAEPLRQILRGLVEALSRAGEMSGAELAELLYSGIKAIERELEKLTIYDLLYDIEAGKRPVGRHRIGKLKDHFERNYGALWCLARNDRAAFPYVDDANYEFYRALLLKVISNPTLGITFLFDLVIHDLGMILQNRGINAHAIDGGIMARDLLIRLGFARKVIFDYVLISRHPMSVRIPMGLEKAEVIWNDLCRIERKCEVSKQDFMDVYFLSAFIDEGHAFEFTNVWTAAMRVMFNPANLEVLARNADAARIMGFRNEWFGTEENPGIAVTHWQGKDLDKIRIDDSLFAEARKRRFSLNPEQIAKLPSLDVTGGARALLAGLQEGALENLFSIIFKIYMPYSRSSMEREILLLAGNKGGRVIENLSLSVNNMLSGVSRKEIGRMTPGDFLRQFNISSQFQSTHGQLVVDLSHAGSSSPATTTSFHRAHCPDWLRNSFPIGSETVSKNSSSSLNIEPYIAAIEKAQFSPRATKMITGWLKRGILSAETEITPELFVQFITEHYHRKSRKGKWLLWKLSDWHEPIRLIYREGVWYQLEGIVIPNILVLPQGDKEQRFGWERIVESGMNRKIQDYYNLPDDYMAVIDFISQAVKLSRLTYFQPRGGNKSYLISFIYEEEQGEWTLLIIAGQTGRILYSIFWNRDEVHIKELSGLLELSFGDVKDHIIRSFNHFNRFGGRHGSFGNLEFWFTLQSGELFALSHHTNTIHYFTPGESFRSDTFNPEKLPAGIGDDVPKVNITRPVQKLTQDLIGDYYNSSSALTSREKEALLKLYFVEVSKILMDFLELYAKRKKALDEKRVMEKLRPERGSPEFYGHEEARRREAKSYNSLKFFAEERIDAFLSQITEWALVGKFLGWALPQNRRSDWIIDFQRGIFGSLQKAPRFIIIRNEPAANTTILGCLDNIVGELEYPFKGRSRPSVYTDIIPNTTTGKFEVVQGQLIKHAVTEKTKVSLRVSIEKKYTSLWEALRAMDDQMDGQLKERAWLWGAIEFLKGLLGDLRDTETISEFDFASAIDGVSKKILDLEKALVTEKELAYYGLGVLKAEFGIEDRRISQISVVLIKRLLNMRLPDIERMILNMLNIPTNRLGSLRKFIDERNEELGRRLDNIIGELRKENFKAALSKTQGFLRSKKVAMYLAEPEFSGVRKQMGFLVKLLKDRNIVEAMAVLGWVRSRVGDADYLSAFIEETQDRYVKENLKQKGGFIKKEAVFEDVFRSYLKKRQLTRGSPQTPLHQRWYTKFYQAAFIPLNIPNPQKKSQRIPNPTFLAVASYIQTLETKGLTAQPNRLIVDALLEDHKDMLGGVNAQQVREACLFDITQWLGTASSSLQPRIDKMRDESQEFLISISNLESDLVKGLRKLLDSRDLEEYYTIVKDELRPLAREVRGYDLIEIKITTTWLNRLERKFAKFLGWGLSEDLKTRIGYLRKLAYKINERRDKVKFLERKIELCKHLEGLAAGIVVKVGVLVRKFRLSRKETLTILNSADSGFMAWEEKDSFIKNGSIHTQLWLFDMQSDSQSSGSSPLVGPWRLNRGKYKYVAAKIAKFLSIPLGMLALTWLASLGVEPSEQVIITTTPVAEYKHLTYSGISDAFLLTINITLLIILGILLFTVHKVSKIYGALFTSALLGLAWFGQWIQENNTVKQWLEKNEGLFVDISLLALVLPAAVVLGIFSAFAIKCLRSGRKERVSKRGPSSFRPSGSSPLLKGKIRGIISEKVSQRLKSLRLERLTSWRERILSRPRSPPETISTATPAKTSPLTIPKEKDALIAALIEMLTFHSTALKDLLLKIPARQWTEEDEESFREISAALEKIKIEGELQQLFALANGELVILTHLSNFSRQARREATGLFISEFSFSEDASQPKPEGSYIADIAKMELLLAYVDAAEIAVKITYLLTVLERLMKDNHIEQAELDDLFSTYREDKEGASSALQLKEQGASFVKENTPRVENCTMVSLQVEMGLSPELMAAHYRWLRERYGYTIKEAVDEIGQLNKLVGTGGLHSLKRDLVSGEKENGVDIISLNPLYTRWMKGVGLVERRLLRRFIEHLGKSIFDYKVTACNGREIEGFVYQDPYSPVPHYWFINEDTHPTPNELFSELYPGMPRDERRIIQEDVMQKAGYLFLEYLQKQGKIKGSLIFLLSETSTTLFMPLVRLTEESFNGRVFAYHYNHSLKLAAMPPFPGYFFDLLGINPILRPFVEHTEEESGTHWVDKAGLTAILTDAIGGCSDWHTGILRKIFSDFSGKIVKNEQYPISEGVFLQTWQHPSLIELVKEEAKGAIGEVVTIREVIDRYHDLTGAKDDKELFSSLESKKLEEQFINDILIAKDSARRFLRWFLKSVYGIDIPENLILLDLTRRLVEYKCLHIFISMLFNETYRSKFLNSDIAILLGGRSFDIHVGDYAGHWLGVLQNVLFVNHPELRKRIFILPDYHLFNSPPIQHGVDGGITLSHANEEAGPTGVTKRLVCGGLEVVSPDGVILELLPFLEGISLFKVEYDENSWPTQDSLCGALVKLSSVYKDPGLYRKAVYASIKVGMITRNITTTQARGIILACEDGLKKKEVRTRYYERGREKAEGLKGQINEAENKQPISGILKEETIFYWKKDNKTTLTLMPGAKGLGGFIQNLKTILFSLGSLGEWVILYHTYYTDNGGDHFNYISHLFSGASKHPLIISATDYFKRLSKSIEQAKQATQDEEILRLHYELFGFLEELNSYSSSPARTRSRNSIRKRVKFSRPRVFNLATEDRLNAKQAYILIESAEYLRKKYGIATKFIIGGRQLLYNKKPLQPRIAVMKLLLIYNLYKLQRLIGSGDNEICVEVIGYDEVSLRQASYYFSLIFGEVFSGRDGLLDWWVSNAREVIPQEIDKCMKVVGRRFLLNAKKGSVRLLKREKVVTYFMRELKAFSFYVQDDTADIVKVYVEGQWIPASVDPFFRKEGVTIRKDMNPDHNFLVLYSLLADGFVSLEGYLEWAITNSKAGDGGKILEVFHLGIAPWNVGKEPKIRGVSLLLCAEFAFKHLPQNHSLPLWGLNLSASSSSAMLGYKSIGRAARVLILAMLLNIFGPGQVLSQDNSDDTQDDPTRIYPKYSLRYGWDPYSNIVGFDYSPKRMKTFSMFLGVINDESGFVESDVVGVEYRNERQKENKRIEHNAKISVLPHTLMDVGALMSPDSSNHDEFGVGKDESENRFAMYFSRISVTTYGPYEGPYEGILLPSWGYIINIQSGYVNPEGNFAVVAALDFIRGEHRIGARLAAGIDSTPILPEFTPQEADIFQLRWMMHSLTLRVVYETEELGIDYLDWLRIYYQESGLLVMRGDYIQQSRKVRTELTTKSLLGGVFNAAIEYEETSQNKPLEFREEILSMDLSKEVNFRLFRLRLLGKVGIFAQIYKSRLVKSKLFNFLAGPLFELQTKSPDASLEFRASAKVPLLKERGLTATQINDSPDVRKLGSDMMAGKIYLDEASNNLENNFVVTDPVTQRPIVNPDLRRLPEAYLVLLVGVETTTAVLSLTAPTQGDRDLYKIAYLEIKGEREMVMNALNQFSPSHIRALNGLKETAKGWAQIANFLNTNELAKGLTYGQFVEDFYREPQVALGRSYGGIMIEEGNKGLAEEFGGLQIADISLFNTEFLAGLADGMAFAYFIAGKLGEDIGDEIKDELVPLFSEVPSDIDGFPLPEEEKERLKKEWQEIAAMDPAERIAFLVENLSTEAIFEIFKGPGGRRVAEYMRDAINLYLLRLHKANTEYQRNILPEDASERLMDFLDKGFSRQGSSSAILNKDNSRGTVRQDIVESILIMLVLIAAVGVAEALPSLAIIGMLTVTFFGGVGIVKLRNRRNRDTLRSKAKPVPEPKQSLSPGSTSESSSSSLEAALTPAEEKCIERLKESLFSEQGIKYIRRYLKGYEDKDHYTATLKTVSDIAFYGRLLLPLFPYLKYVYIVGKDLEKLLIWPGWLKARIIRIFDSIYLGASRLLYAFGFPYNEKRLKEVRAFNRFIFQGVKFSRRSDVLAYKILRRQAPDVLEEYLYSLFIQRIRNYSGVKIIKDAEYKELLERMSESFFSNLQLTENERVLVKRAGHRLHPDDDALESTTKAQIYLAAVNEYGGLAPVLEFMRMNDGEMVVRRYKLREEEITVKDAWNERLLEEVAKGRFALEEDDGRILFVKIYNSSSAVAQKKFNVLICCDKNNERSPYAEFALRRELSRRHYNSKVDVRSAGLYINKKEISVYRGVDPILIKLYTFLQDHIRKPIGEYYITSFHLLFVFTKSQRAFLSRFKRKRGLAAKDSPKVKLFFGKEELEVALPGYRERPTETAEDARERKLRIAYRIMARRITVRLDSVIQEIEKEMVLRSGRERDHGSSAAEVLGYSEKPEKFNRSKYYLHALRFIGELNKGIPKEENGLLETEDMYPDSWDATTRVLSPMADALERMFIDCLSPSAGTFVQIYNNVDYINKGRVNKIKKMRLVSSEIYKHSWVEIEFFGLDNKVLVLDFSIVPLGFFRPVGVKRFYIGKPIVARLLDIDGEVVVDYTDSNKEILMAIEASYSSSPSKLRNEIERLTGLIESEYDKIKNAVHNSPEGFQSTHFQDGEWLFLMLWIKRQRDLLKELEDLQAPRSSEEAGSSSVVETEESQMATERRMIFYDPYEIERGSERTLRSPGILPLIQLLRDKGHKVDFASNRDQLFMAVVQNTYDAVGIAVTYPALHWGLETALNVKVVDPCPVVMLGGQGLPPYSETLVEYPAVDIVLEGEAEKILPLILPQLKRKGSKRGQVIPFEEIFDMDAAQKEFFTRTLGGNFYRSPITAAQARKIMSLSFARRVNAGNGKATVYIQVGLEGVFLRADNGEIYKAGKISRRKAYLDHKAAWERNHQGDYPLSEGDFIKNYHSYPTSEELDETFVGYPWDIIEEGNWALFSIYTQRGCPKKPRCGFCAVTNPPGRRNSVPKVMEMLHEIAQHGVEESMFCDSIFTQKDENRGWVIDLLTLIREEGLHEKLALRLQTAVDYWPDAKILELMRRANVQDIGVGAETSLAEKAEYLVKTDRGENYSRMIQEIVDEAHSHGIGVVIAKIYLTPETTLRELSGELERDSELLLDSYKVFKRIPYLSIGIILEPYPRTRLTEERFVTRKKIIYPIASPEYRHERGVMVRLIPIRPVETPDGVQVLGIAYPEFFEFDLQVLKFNASISELVRDENLSPLEFIKEATVVLRGLAQEEDDSTILEACDRIESNINELYELMQQDSGVLTVEVEEAVGAISDEQMPPEKAISILLRLKMAMDRISELSEEVSDPDWTYLLDNLSERIAQNVNGFLAVIDSREDGDRILEGFLNNAREPEAEEAGSSSLGRIESFNPSQHRPQQKINRKAGSSAVKNNSDPISGLKEIFRFMDKQGLWNELREVKNMKELRDWGVKFLSILIVSAPGLTADIIREVKRIIKESTLRTEEAREKFEEFKEQLRKAFHEMEELANKAHRDKVFTDIQLEKTLRIIKIGRWLYDIFLDEPRSSEEPPESAGNSDGSSSAVGEDATVPAWRRNPYVLKKNIRRRFSSLNALFNKEISKRILAKVNQNQKKGAKTNILWIGPGAGYEVFELMYLLETDNKVDLENISSFTLAEVYLLEESPARIVNWFKRKKKIAVSLADAERYSRYLLKKSLVYDLNKDGLPFKQEVFDIIIICHSVSEYIEDRIKVFNALKKRLKRRGIGFMPLSVIRPEVLFDAMEDMGNDFEFIPNHALIITNHNPDFKIPLIFVKSKKVIRKYGQKRPLPYYQTYYKIDLERLIHQSSQGITSIYEVERGVRKDEAGSSSAVGKTPEIVSISLDRRRREEFISFGSGTRGNPRGLFQKFSVVKKRHDLSKHGYFEGNKGILEVSAAPCVYAIIHDQRTKKTYAAEHYPDRFRKIINLIDLAHTILGNSEQVEIAIGGLGLSTIARAEDNVARLKYREILLTHLHSRGYTDIDVLFSLLCNTGADTYFEIGKSRGVSRFHFMSGLGLDVSSDRMTNQELLEKQAKGFFLPPASGSSAVEGENNSEIISSPIERFSTQILSDTRWFMSRYNKEGWGISSCQAYSAFAKGALRELGSRMVKNIKIRDEHTIVEWLGWKFDAFPGGNCTLYRARLGDIVGINTKTLIIRPGEFEDIFEPVRGQEAKIEAFSVFLLKFLSPTLDRYLVSDSFMQLKDRFPPMIEKAEIALEKPEREE